MLTLLFSLALAGDSDWSIEASFGDTHTVQIDVDEGTWLNVSAHGNTVVFDLLGDLWSISLDATDPQAAVRLTEGPAWDGQPTFSPDGTQLAFVSDRGGNENLWVMNADGTDPRPITEEDVARVTHPVWDEDGQWVIGRRRTVDTRSIGVTELWQYSLDGGDGRALTSKDAHPHAGEHVVTPDHIWFSTRHGRFSYNENPAGGLWHIERLDRETGDLRSVVYGPGSQSRPMLHPDGQRLLFLTRDRTRTLLEIMDVETGQRRIVADWLSHDNLEGFALHATYPKMDWTEDGELVLWADGKLWVLNVDTGERRALPFTVSGEWTQHDVPRVPIAVEDQQMARVLRWPTLSARGALAFSALGQLYVRTADGQVVQVSEGTGYSPTWSPSGEDLLYTSWSDTTGGQLHYVPGRSRPEVLPVRGQLVRPAFSEDGNQVVVLRGGGGAISPDLGAERWFEVVLLSRTRKGWTTQVVTTVDARGANARAPRLHLREGRVYFMEDRYEQPRTPSQTVLISVNLEGRDKREHLMLGGAEEAVLSPDFRHVAYRVGHQLHVARLPAHLDGINVDGGEVPTEQVTTIVGDWLDFSSDSQTVSWIEGNVFKSIPLGALFQPEDEDEDEEGEDEDAEDEDEDPLAEHEAVVSETIQVPFTRHQPEGVVALTHARVVTMNGDEVLENTTVVIDGSRIVAIGGDVPEGATEIDCTGKTVIPGLVDVHAHLHYTAGDVHPEQEWRYLTSLDFGVTTVQDPSASTDLVFTQAERVEAGMMTGPRVYSTGFVLYGALANDGAKTPTPEAAVAHVRRLKAVGARSVKVYQQSQRERRQWYVKACQDEGVLCVPEGGGDLWMNLNMVADGFHAIEHSLPMAPVYSDVLQFWAGSPTDGTFGTAYTQTLLVAYGGLGAENYFLQHDNPVEDERLLRHHPRRLLDAYAWRPTVMAQDGDWRHVDIARDAAKMAREGVLVSLGAHGQLQGLGVHWELWAMASEGAMTPHEALRAATIGGARYMGLDGELGTIEVGKLADLIILDDNPLEDIRRSTDISAVIKNGQLFE